MTKAVLLDCCTLGEVTNPSDNPENREAQEWATELHRKGTLIRVPEIADYELRRELIRTNKTVGIAELDEAIRIFGYAPLCTRIMRRAAELWANAHRLIAKIANADPRLDADVILCATAMVLAIDESAEVIVATDNLKHFLPFVQETGFIDAKPWQEIEP